MSFGNASIFPFPAVQYIPMAITNLAQGTLNPENTSSLPAQIITGDQVTKWRAVFWDYGLNLPEVFSNDSFPILALHLKVQEVKYRGFFVTMIGSKNYGNYQLFTLPKRYFYKHKLCFELFDEISGERLARYSLFMP